MRKDLLPHLLSQLALPWAASGAMARSAAHRMFGQIPTARSDRMAIATTVTKESIRAIIDGVENDPLAGVGCYTKKEILIDRLLAHCRSSQQAAAPLPAPRPILTEPVAVEVATDKAA
jgi:hypothetical protein